MARSVHALFRETASARPAAVAARHKVAGAWRDVTWAEMAATADRLTAGLMSLGVAPGDRVGLLSNTRLEWCLADLGIMGAAAVTVPIYQSNLAAECEYILRDADASVVLVEDGTQLAKLRRVRAGIPGVRTVVCLDGGAVDRGGAWEVAWDDLLAAGDAWLADRGGDVAARAAGLGPDAVLTIIYTSGTTGPPKGAVLTHDCMLYEAEAIRAIGMVGPEDVEYLFLPLAHAFARVLEVAWFATGHVMAFWQRDQTKIVDDLGEVRPTVFAAVPRILEKVHARVVEDVERAPGLGGRLARWGLAKGREAAAVEAAGGRPRGLGWAVARTLVYGAIGRRLHARFGGRLRFCVSGGAPLAPDIARFFQHAGVTVCEGYGLTETSAGTCINRPDHVVPGSVGPPLPGTEVRIAPDGEVLIRGRGVMRGYWRREADTREVLDPDGWFHSGDIGTLDGEGLLRITDRKKDIIVTAGGKNIAPQNIENALKSIHPLISQVVVHGDMQRYLTALVTLDGDAVLAWARARGVAEPDYAALTRHPDLAEEIQRAVDQLNRQLPSYSTLKRVAILDHDFEVGDQLTPTLKVKRRVCIDRYRAQLEAMYAPGTPSDRASG
ncbi:MAG TPA: long-chain fatty acid--CoA ligase [Candidatus Binatia bacterium]|nr:long-chain fatty acid--CoA ligase [Candidatus Binatia bacterium]